jgi:hypothetical protein
MPPLGVRVLVRACVRACVRMWGLQTFCIILFLYGASLFGTLISQVSLLPAMMPWMHIKGGFKPLLRLLAGVWMGRLVWAAARGAVGNLGSTPEKLVFFCCSGPHRQTPSASFTLPPLSWRLRQPEYAQGGCVCEPETGMVELKRFEQVNDILMTASRESRELENHVEKYVSFMKAYK